MAILGGKEIVKRLGTDIEIENFDMKKVNPNSYNLTLNEKLLVYTCPVIDMKKDNPTEEIIIPEEGYVLEPGRLYLAKVNEYTKTHNLVPIVEGRSSVGRLGLSVHPSTGFGDNGFEGRFTLELTVAQPLRVYKDVEICQIVFHTIEGESDKYKGRYQHSEDVVSCRLHKDYK